MPAAALLLYVDRLRLFFATRPLPVAERFVPVMPEEIVEPVVVPVGIEPAFRDAEDLADTLDPSRPDANDPEDEPAADGADEDVDGADEDVDGVTEDGDPAADDGTEAEPGWSGSAG